MQTHFAGRLQRIDSCYEIAPASADFLLGIELLDRLPFASFW
jgi:hypothetical protein